MSDYNKSTNFTTKDTLPSGNSQKLVKGTELDIEFTNIASAIASKANADSAALTGTPTAPTAAAGTNTTQIATTAFINQMFSGIITMWSGSVASIPVGWYLCNGSNGTPDLRDRFVIGAGSNYAVGATGGSKDAIVVSHSHSASTVDINHTHYFSATTDGMSANNPHSHATYGAYGGGGNPGGSLNVNNPGGMNQGTTSTDINHTHNVYGNTGYMNSGNTHSHTIDAAGASGTNANLPPYYALAFIMKA